MKSRELAVVLGASLSLLSFAPETFAQSGGNVQTRAEDLFREGRRLVESGDIEHACSKFEESYRLDPRGGTLINLADCFERARRWASAKAGYERVVATDPKEERRVGARERLAAITPHVFYVIVDVKHAEPGITVTRDGELLASSDWSKPLAVDPGPHRWEAQAPNRTPWSMALIVPFEGGTATVDIPSLAPLGGVAGSSDPHPEPPTQPIAENGASHASTWPRPLSYGLLGLGVVGLGFGTVFGLNASATWSDARAQCSNVAASRCASADAVTLSHDARSEAMLSTISFVAGTALASAGLVLFFLTRPATSKSALTVGHDLRLGVTF